MKKAILITGGVLTSIVLLLYWLVPGIFPEFTMPYWLGGPRYIVVERGSMPKPEIPDLRYEIRLDRKTNHKEACLFTDRLPGPMCQPFPEETK